MTRGKYMGVYIWIPYEFPEVDPDLRVHMARAAATIPDGVIILPPGDFYAGDLGPIGPTSPYLHPYNPALPRNGWIVIAAQFPRAEDPALRTKVHLDPTAAGAVARDDMTKGGALYMGRMTDNPGTYGGYRIIFDGLFYMDGCIIINGGTLVRLFNTDHTYPSYIFVDDYNAAARLDGLSVPTDGFSSWDPIPTTDPYYLVSHYDGATYPDYMKRNAVPRCIGFDMVAGWAARYCTIDGADIHNIGDDGIFTGKSYHGMRARGTKIWDNYNYNGIPSTAGWVHPDVVQLVGHENDWLFDYCWLGGHVQIGAEPDIGPISNVKFNHIWQSGSYSSGLSLDASGNPCSVDIAPLGFDNGDYYYWFGNGQNAGVWASDHLAHMQYESGGDNPIATAGTPGGTRNITHRWPSDAEIGGTQDIFPVAADVGGVGAIPYVWLDRTRPRLSQETIEKHYYNPAEVWRRSHSDRDEFYAGTYD